MFVQLFLDNASSRLCCCAISGIKINQVATEYLQKRVNRITNGRRPRKGRVADKGNGTISARPESGSDRFYKGVGRLWSSAAYVASGRETERNTEQCLKIYVRIREST